MGQIERENARPDTGVPGAATVRRMECGCGMPVAVVAIRRRSGGVRRGRYGARFQVGVCAERQDPMSGRYAAGDVCGLQFDDGVGAGGGCVCTVDGQRSGGVGVDVEE